MNFDKDYYATLGVLPTIDDAALSAVYRALLKKYHPDVYRGAKADADRITKEINEAHETLSNPRTRAEYDRRRGDRSRRRSDDYGDEGRKQESNRENADEGTLAQWRFVVRYHPEAESYRSELAVLSENLALSFQVTIVETKAVSTAKELSDALKQQFLEQYFGTNKMVHQLVVDALRAKRRDVAAEVNAAIKVLGSPTAQTVLQFIETVQRVTGWTSHGTSPSKQDPPPSRQEPPPRREEPPATAPAGPSHAYSNWDRITLFIAAIVALVVFKLVVK